MKLRDLLADPLSLPARMPLEDAGEVLNYRRTYLYEAARRGELPFQVHRVGRRLVVNTLDVLREAGVEISNLRGRIETE